MIKLKDLLREVRMMSISRAEDVFTRYSGINVSKESTSMEEVKKIFRQLTKKYHPDMTGGGDDAVCKQIIGAYERLCSTDPDTPEPEPEPEPEPRPKYQAKYNTTEPEVEFDESDLEDIKRDPTRWIKFWKKYPLTQYEIMSYFKEFGFNSKQATSWKYTGPTPEDSPFGEYWPDGSYGKKTMDDDYDDEEIDDEIPTIFDFIFEQRMEVVRTQWGDENEIKVDYNLSLNKLKDILKGGSRKIIDNIPNLDIDHIIGIIAIDDNGKENKNFYELKNAMRREDIKLKHGQNTGDEFTDSDETIWDPKESEFLFGYANPLSLKTYIFNNEKMVKKIYVYFDERNTSGTRGNRFELLRTSYQQYLNNVKTLENFKRTTFLKELKNGLVNMEDANSYVSNNVIEYLLCYRSSVPKNDRNEIS